MHYIFLVSLIPTGTGNQQINNFKSGQILFRFLHSLSTVRLHVSQGLPFLVPIPSREFHCIACRATEDSYFHRVFSIQPHLCILMITSICCISAIFNRFILDIETKCKSERYSALCSMINRSVLMWSMQEDPALKPACSRSIQ